MVPVKYFFKKLPVDAGELEKLAQQLGVSLAETISWAKGLSSMNIYEVQRRIREAIADARNSWIWIFAVASAVASVFSALAAWRTAISLCK
jgi:hypothetical protein